MDSLGTRPPKVGMRKVRESIKEVQVGWVGGVDPGAQHPSLLNTVHEDWVFTQRFGKRQLLVLATWWGQLDPFAGIRAWASPWDQCDPAWSRSLRCCEGGLLLSPNQH